MVNFGYAQKIEYIYDANGTKKRKSVTYYPNDGGLIVLKTDHIEYMGGYQYKNGELQFFPTAEGYVRNTQGALSYAFQYRDHLGNIRLSYAGSRTAPIMEENHYYPFGLKHEKYNSDTYEFVEVEGSDGYYTGIELSGPNAENSYQYKYNGKEFQDELGLNMYAMDMRQYDPAIGRWVVQDPIVHHNMSPYNAVMYQIRCFTKCQCN